MRDARLDFYLPDTVIRFGRCALNRIDEIATQTRVGTRDVFLQTRLPCQQLAQTRSLLLSNQSIQHDAISLAAILLVPRSFHFHLRQTLPFKISMPLSGRTHHMRIHLFNYVGLERIMVWNRGRDDVVILGHVEAARTNKLERDRTVHHGMKSCCYYSSSAKWSWRLRR